MAILNSLINPLYSPASLSFFKFDMIIAVTGASGHIGVNLCAGLEKAGHEVRALIHQSHKGLENLDVKMIFGNILDPESLVELTANADVLIHTAAAIGIQNRDKKVWQTNVQGTENVLKICLENRVNLVHFSSIHAYNPFPLGALLDDSRPLDLDSRWIYSQSKAEAHQRVREAFRRGLRGIIFCPTSVLGPNDYKPSLQGEAISKFYHGKIPALIPGGYDWVDVRDIANVVVRALKEPMNQKEYLLPGHWRSMYELAACITKFGGKRPPSFTCPFWLARLGLPLLNLNAYLTHSKPLYTPASLDALQFSAQNISYQKATADFNFEPRPFEETLSDTIEWLKSNKQL